MRFELIEEDKEMIREGIIEPFKVATASWKNFFQTLLMGFSIIGIYFIFVALA